jgi:uncharacterized protein (DUF1330 family)
LRQPPNLAKRSTQPFHWENIEMAAYFIAKYTVTNPEGFKAYGAAVGPTFAGHDMEVIVLDHSSDVVEGNPGENTVVLKFPSKDAALAWYNSDAYQAIKHHRTDNSEGDIVLVDSFSPPA